MILRIADIPVCISIDPALGELPLPASYSAFIEADSFYEANEADGFYETNEATGSAGATEKSGEAPTLKPTLRPTPTLPPAQTLKPTQKQNQGSPAFSVASVAPVAPAAPKEKEEEVTLRVTQGEAPFSIEGLTPVATGVNDLGEARLYEKGGIYVVALSATTGEPFRLMRLDRGFGGATLWLPAGNRHNLFTIDSMLRILFAQAAVSRDALAVHASTVVADGFAYLFMGKSGTGKSTHSSLWIKTFPGVELLNDDNPILRLQPDGTVRVYGSPWSGKTPCYRNASAPVRAIVRLRQAPANEYRPLADIEAFTAILPGVSAITSDRALYNRAATTVIELTRRVSIGTLLCLPDAAAARLCRKATEADGFYGANEAYCFLGANVPRGWGGPTYKPGDPPTLKPTPTLPPAQTLKQTQKPTQGSPAFSLAPFAPVAPAAPSKKKEKEKKH